MSEPLRRGAKVAPAQPSIAVGFQTLSFQNPHRPPLDQIRSRAAHLGPQIPQARSANPVQVFCASRVFCGQPTNSPTAAAGPGEIVVPGRILSAAPRTKCGRTVANPASVHRGCPGATRRSPRFRASVGSPSGWRLAAPPAIPKSPSQPEGCSEFPAVNLSLLLRSGRS